MTLRDFLLRALVVWGVAVFAITEFLSAFGELRRTPLLVCWIGVALAGILFLRRRRLPRLTQLSPGARDPVVIFSLAGIAWILTLTALTALCSPPNSADAMAYHLPRVVYWAEQSSIRFFPTPYLNQISLQPLAEFVMLHTYLLSGGDRFVNLVQWLASLGCIVGVSAIAREFGAAARGQVLAALFCATLPSGILAASGAKNDYFLALWLIASIYFAARFARTGGWRDLLFLGCALGLALLTKATGYLFAPCLLAAVLLPRLDRRLPAAAVCALLINAPHFARNYQLSGSVLGFDSAQGDGVYRWRNDTFGWKQTASNILRNVSEQLGARSNRWNQSVYSDVLRLHRWLGIDPNDPATTWPWATFQPPQNTNHEANVNSQWHLLIVLMAAICACVMGRAVRPVGWYSVALLAAFIAFCAYLKWQPYEARLFLPLLVAAAPLAGVMIEALSNRLPKMPRLVLQLLLCVFLLSVARRPVLENWVRPWRGPRSVLHVPRRVQYFADMVEWDIRPAYERSAALLLASACRTIGIDSGDFQLEYPLMALLHEGQPVTVFVHTGVANASTRYAQPVPQAPCAVVCLNCLGDQKREALYANFPAKTAVDKFLVFSGR